MYVLITCIHASHLLLPVALCVVGRITIVDGMGVHAQFSCSGKSSVLQIVNGRSTQCERTAREEDRDMNMHLIKFTNASHHWRRSLPSFFSSCKTNKDLEYTYEGDRRNPGGVCSISLLVLEP